jgi:hypothetical protein
VIRVAAILFTLALCGCAGRATVHVTSLDTKKITATGPLVVRASPDECYFWVNERHELCVAMRSANASLAGKRFEREFALSLVLDGPPAGSARQYSVGRRAMRARARAGFSHTRSASLSGVVLIMDYGADKLRGRFRLIAKQQTYSVLTGWKGDHRVLFVGEFDAVSNRSAGEKILARSEAEGMGRGAAPVKSLSQNCVAPASCRCFHGLEARATPVIGIGSKPVPVGGR